MIPNFMLFCLYDPWWGWWNYCWSPWFIVFEFFELIFWDVDHRFKTTTCRCKIDSNKNDISYWIVNIIWLSRLIVYLHRSLKFLKNSLKRYFLLRINILFFVSVFLLAGCAVYVLILNLKKIACLKNSKC